MFSCENFSHSISVFLIQELVLEKDTCICESMFMMGLSQWVLWSAWYLKQFIFLFIAVVVMSILVVVDLFFIRVKSM